MNIKKALASFTVFVILLLPLDAWARPPMEVVDRQAQTIARSAFIGWSLDVLEIPRQTEKCVLPWKRFPKGLTSLLCTADSYGALDPFSNKSGQYTLGQSVTRGEALSILTMLTNARDSADIASFKDVKTERDRQGVMNAVSRKWMLPVRASFFGINRPLTGQEALAVLTSVTGTSPATTPNQVTITIGNQAGLSGSLPKQDLLDAVWQILKRDYLHTDKIDDQEVAYKAAEALVNALGDPYTNFFRPVNAANFSDQLKGELSGIGAQVEDKSGTITIVTPLPGSPAERAGLLPGDQIIEANGHVLQGIGVDQAVQFIRGERGTVVRLKIGRGGQIIEISVIRDMISLPEISVSWQGDIAIVQLMQFGQTTERRIRGVFADIATKNPRGVVLDLRNNGGGLLTAADLVLSNFVPRDSVVAKVKTRTSTEETVTQFEPTLPASVKLAVLINKGSASASEIVAGALQDFKRATIVGTQSFGKGTVQEVLGFPSGEAIKVTIAEWLTPLGRKIDGIGVKPDVMVDTDDLAAQLRRALDVLR